MSDDDVTVAVSVAELISRELEEDYVGLWVLPWHIRRAIPDATDEQVQRLAASILNALTATDVALGDLDEETGHFMPWPEGHGADIAMASWKALGRDPNIGEVAWLARCR